MNTQQTPDYAAQLQQLRTDLLDQIRQQRGGEVGRAEATAQAREHDGSDWASNDAQRDLAVALEERELAELNDIDAALTRWADGQFGLCEDCDATIPDARLHANPSVRRCVACQTAVEQQTHATTHTSL